MDGDFPAAHSMDTNWFAVDAAGHVAHFYSGQAGAVPVGSAQDPRWEVQRRLPEALPRVEPVYDLGGHFSALAATRQPEHHCADRGSPYGGLFFLKATDPVEQEIRTGAARMAAATEGVAILFAQLSDELARRLHQGNHCLGCFFHFFEPGDETWMCPVERVGLYGYAHPFGNWLAEPYGRRVRPAHPLHLAQLPPDLRDAFSKVRFDCRFADTVYIQPAETYRVTSLEPAYLTADGKAIRRVRDNTFEPDPAYEEFHAEMTGRYRTWLEGVTVEPPEEDAADEEGM